MSPFTATFAVTVLAFVALWWVSTRTGDVSLVDVYWGPGFVVVATVALLTGAGTDPRRFLVVTLVAMWGFRLGAYLAWRRQGQGEDFRYAAMRRRFGDDFRLVSLVVVFLLQAVLQWIVSWPVQWVLTTPSAPALGFLDLVGVGLFAPSSGRTPRTRARCSTAASGATRAIRTTSATAASGGASTPSRWRRRTGGGRSSVRW